MSANAETTQIVKAAEHSMVPVMTLAQLADTRNQMVQIVKSGVMVDGLHYGTIPGTAKPCLLKAGAEMLTMLFGLSTIPAIINQIEDWDGSGQGNGEALFYYTYRVSIMRGSLLITSGDGSANSRESKHRWRWVNEDEVPSGLPIDRLLKRGGTLREAQWRLDRAETTGKYGKPQEHWQSFLTAIANGTARKITIPKKNSNEVDDGWEIDSTQYRIPNDDVASLVNTIQKMAMKRALVAAVLLATGASEFYTQDMEDFADAPLSAGASVQPTETIEQLHEAFGAIYNSASPYHLKRIQRMMAAIVGKRLNDTEWTLSESRALRDGALAICQQPIEETQPTATPKPVDNPAPTPSGTITDAQDAEIKAKMSSKAPTKAAEAPVTPKATTAAPNTPDAATARAEAVGQLADDDKAAIEAQEAKEAAAYHAPLPVDDELDDPFASEEEISRLHGVPKK